MLSKNVPSMKAIRDREKATLWGINKNWKKTFKIRWTYELFIEAVKNIHGDFYDCSSVTKGQIIMTKTSITVIHKYCGEIWIVPVEVFLTHNCPMCSKGLWNLKRFIKCSKELHGNKFNYDLITEKDIVNGHSKVPLVCISCGYSWSCIINCHTHGLSGCPSCAGNAPWTLERFIASAIKIHGDKYNYSQITKDDIQNQRSKVPIECCKCSKKFLQAIHDHINNGAGCWDCGYNVWTLDRFITEAMAINEGIYNYSLVKTEHINGKLSSVPIICLRCNSTFNQTLGHHIYDKCGCPHCRISHGETETKKILNFLGIPITKMQFRFSEYPRLAYDFVFTYKDKWILIEYDGAQHFIARAKWTKWFPRRRHLDIFKTQLALKNNYKLIRIDYTQLKHIQYHIEKALSQDEPIYYSKPEVYKWIIESPEVELGDFKDFLPNNTGTTDYPDDEDLLISDEQIQNEPEDDGIDEIIEPMNKINEPIDEIIELVD